VLGTVSTALDAANRLFGGVFGRAADLGERARSATWEKAHDDAFVAASEELKPDFIQCPRCSSWVCKKSCWNARRGLCKECAPDIQVEKAAAQARKTSQAVWENAQTAEEDAEEIAPAKFKKSLRATCPSCNAPLPKGVKFCPECGAKIEVEAHCTECDAKLLPGSKFCPECSAKVH